MQQPHPLFPVVRSETPYVGKIFAVQKDEVSMPQGNSAIRDYVQHYGAVAVVALNEHDQVAVIRQYRHPMRDFLYEIPAGILDGPDLESPWETAQRELREEIGFHAQKWHSLVTVASSPGMTDEVVKIYLAQSLEPTTLQERSDEEAHITLEWISLTKCVSMIFEGVIVNATAVAGILSAYTAQLSNLTNPESEMVYRPQSFRNLIRSQR